MAVKFEKLEKSRVLLEITVEQEEVSLAYSRVIKKTAGEINIPGFRKGKAPQHIIEKYADADYLKERVIDLLVKPALIKAYQETEILPVAAPTIDIVQMEKDMDFIFKVTVEVKPEVSLGKYKGLEVEKKTVEVTDEQVDQELKSRQSSHARLLTLEEGEVLDQDVVTIDFEGFVDNVPFEGGKGENFDLGIGSGQFIPGFEEQLIGTNVGQETEINVPFPADYQNQDLAGKDSIFKVKIKSIKRKELSELDDEFAKDISEFDTLAELREDIKKNLTTAAEKRAENEFRSEVVKKAVDNASVEIPDGMIQERIDSMLQEIAMRLSYQGMSMEQYYQYVNTNKEQVRESYSIQATEGIKTELVLEAIAKKEEITVSDEDVEKEIEKLSAQYGKKSEELKASLESRGEMEWFKVGLASDRVVDLLTDDATAGKAVTEKEENSASE